MPVKVLTVQPLENEQDDLVPLMESLCALVTAMTTLCITLQKSLKKKLGRETICICNDSSGYGQFKQGVDTVEGTLKVSTPDSSGEETLKQTVIQTSPDSSGEETLKQTTLDSSGDETLKTTVIEADKTVIEAGKTDADKTLTPGGTSQNTSTICPKRLKEEGGDPNSGKDFSCNCKSKQ